MENLKIPKDALKVLKNLQKESLNMKRTAFNYNAFNRKFRSILKFTKQNDNYFGIRIKGFQMLNIEIEEFPHGKYATIYVNQSPFKFSFFIQYTRDLIEKILQYNLLIKRPLTAYI